MTKNKKIVAIHQPDFMPWLGFFNKLVKADIFVILDHVINRPNDGIWTKRVKIIVNKQAQWITIPVIKPKGVEFTAINTWEIQLNDKRNIKKLSQTIVTNYKKAPFFHEVFYLVENYFIDTEKLLAIRNMKFINKICEKTGIKTPIIFSSDLNCKKKSTYLLIEICNKVTADTYICGGGADSYQQDEKFEKVNIELVYQNFQHPIYNQFNTDKFIPGLSIIDSLMNLGFDGIKKILNK